ncbi:GNAT family N-acetyltransferase [Nocardia sp. BMG51109]|uniref:GNAT family N-acetyltransferase n=1 Tax=Nocardia sp. BMG51109 TaxID=1056816 RepID=UPI0004B8FDBC|nr:GNAT family N-acetyltransferase [Nocardia sp. BMG51109]
MGSEVSVRRAEPAEARTVAQVFAAAAADEAVSAWVMDGHPDVAESFREQYMPDMIARALSEDEIWVAGAGDDIWTVSVWQTVTSPDRARQEAQQSRELFDAMPRRPFRRMAAVTAAIAEHHPQRFPHRYLQAIVTLPGHRGSGAGGALLADRIRAATEAGVPAYLEASTERSARLYARHGFERTGDPIPLPENGPILIPMWFPGRSRDLRSAGAP